MNSTLNPAVRPLSVKLNAFTDGDLAFKEELIQLMIGNLCELQASIKGSDAFEKILHKIKSTLTIIDDERINSLIAEIKLARASSRELGSMAKADQLFQLIEGLIKDLNDEASIQKAS